MKKNIIIISFVAVVIDQLIKFLACSFLHTINLIPGFLSLTYAENNGVAFSMLSGNRIVIVLISVILITFLMYFMNKDYLIKKKTSFLKDVTYGLLFGGILGNLFDRVVRGVVIDYVSLNIFGYAFPIFNLADVLITIGVILLLISYVKEK